MRVSGRDPLARVERSFFASRCSALVAMSVALGASMLRVGSDDARPRRSPLHRVVRGIAAFISSSLDRASPGRRRFRGRFPRTPRPWVCSRQRGRTICSPPASRRITLDEPLAEDDAGPRFRAALEPLSGTCPSDGVRRNGRCLQQVGTTSPGAPRLLPQPGRPNVCTCAGRIWQRVPRAHES